MIDGKDLIGKRFGKLVVIAQIFGKAKTKSRFLCLCDCGKQKELGGSYLPYGRAKSCGCGRRLNVRHNAISLTLYAYRKHAKKRGLTFDLDRKTLARLIEHPCFYCGKIGTNRTYAYKKPNEEDVFYHNGIDRIENEKGYTIENSVSCCKLCNHMKWSLSFKEWIEHMQTVLNTQQLTA
jgi:5-methylcytosine-specific restriction endonuclease McrA